MAATHWQDDKSPRRAEPGDLCPVMRTALPAIFPFVSQPLTGPVHPYRRLLPTLFRRPRTKNGMTWATGSIAVMAAADSRAYMAIVVICPKAAPGGRDLCPGVCTAGALLGEVAEGSCGFSCR